VTTLQNWQPFMCGHPSQLRSDIPLVNSRHLAIYSSAEYFDHTESGCAFSSSSTQGLPFQFQMCATIRTLSGGQLGNVVFLTAVVKLSVDARLPNHFRFTNATGHQWPTSRCQRGLATRLSRGRVECQPMTAGDSERQGIAAHLQQGVHGPVRKFCPVQYLREKRMLIQFPPPPLLQDGSL
jgi:hypothetical protein